MSHKATSWAFHQSGLKPAAKLVLLALADCHNPVKGCFPSHEYIARICCISERSVRTQLDVLEGLGLIRRNRVNSSSGRKSNNYILCFNDDETHPTAKSAVGENAEAQRQKTDSPTAKSAGSQRQNLPPNLVRGTVRDNPPNPPRGAKRDFSKSGFSASKESVKRIQARLASESKGEKETS